MRITKTVILIVALIVSGLTFQIALTEKVQGADVLQGTCWDDDGMELCFKNGGAVAYEDMFEREMSGTYNLNGESLTMSFERGQRAIAKLSGNKIIGKWSESPDKDPFDFTLTKRK